MQAHERDVEAEIFDLPCTEVADDDPRHIAWQEIMHARMQEIQESWNDAEWERRRGKIQPLTLDEMH